MANQKRTAATTPADPPQMQRILIGTNEDGTPRYHYFNPGGHIVMTATHHSGEVELPDGTVYDVTDGGVQVDSHLHGLQVAAILEGRDPAEVTDDHVADVEDGTPDGPVMAKVSTLEGGK